ncbi:MAG TPA: ribbon-helix-helix domain-containing protein [Actinomycetota bacterium]|nr:ribbon-helix-helix domain-containing protein [Actinomycetota bacterium]
MRRTTVWLTDEDVAALRDLSWRTGRTRSDLIREGIRSVVGDGPAPAGSDLPGAPAEHAPAESGPAGRVKMHGLGLAYWKRRLEYAVILHNIGTAVPQIAVQLQLTEDEVEEAVASAGWSQGAG